MNVLVWLKRDLRIHDHPALALAAGIGPVLPVFVVEPELWSEPDASARQWGFVAESLADLRDDLAGIGAPLVVRVGDAVQVLAGLCRRHRVTRIVSHAETGTAWVTVRNSRVAAWAREAGIEWSEVSQPALPLRPSSGERTTGEGMMIHPALPTPALRAVEGVEPGPIPSARALRLAPDPCPHRQLGGRARGLELLGSFLTHRGEPYRVAQASPLAAERTCSRLSPHLSHGTLSLREVGQSTALRQEERPGGRWGGALSRFQSNLAARELALPAQRPELAGPDAFPLAVTSRDGDAVRLSAWVNGETGLPFLDACLRYLRATGWLNVHMRAMVASVASCHLGLDWRATGAHLARMFTDYDPGLHWPQVQMQSGAMGITIPRICNPVKLGLDQDPAGSFTRRWLPELAGVPDAFLHEPWRWPEARRLLGHRYPEPAVDLATAAREARARLRQARPSAGFAETTSQFVRRPVRQPGNRQPQASQAQLSLPF